MLDINDINKRLKHRYPFLLIDRVLEYEEGKWAKGIKNVTINEPYFNGHFPDYPVMPGVLIIEAMAQLTGILAGEAGVSGYLAGIYKARFSRPVVPGDQLMIETRIASKMENMAMVKAHAEVSGERVAMAELGFYLLNEEKPEKDEG